MNENAIIPVAIVAALVIFVVIARSKNVKKAGYDERQLLARNTAYKVSFFFLLIYCFTCGLLHILNVNWAGIAVQMFLGIILSFTLFIALCIIRAAYFSSSPKKNLYAVLSFFVYCIMSVYFLFSHLGDGKTFWENGQLSHLFLELVASVCFFALGILSVIKLILDKRGAEK